MMERIQQKIDGQEISMPPEEAAESKIIDLMEALKASVDDSGKRKPARRAAKAAKPKAKAKARKRSSG
jgi:non-homologous end joining protein Ku